MLNVGIVGASGYGGGELMRLLLRHPDATLHCAVSETYSGKPLSTSFPGLMKTTNLRFQSYGDGAELAECDVVFLAQENGKALEKAPQLLEAGCKVIDLSADYRLDTKTYEQWYKITHTSPEWNERAVYGLPELNASSIRDARLVANPGCYPTATLLALAPLLTDARQRPEPIIDLHSIIVDAKSGVSGAGRSKFSQEYHFPEQNENVTAYKIAGTHRHTPEIEQTLSRLTGNEIAITFTPHLIPMTRGILATCYASLLQPVTTEELIRLYQSYYVDTPFTAVLTEGLPGTKHTLGSNFCHIGLAVDARTQRVTVVSAIDNLVKGMAGQAIQNMNLMCGLKETAGLEHGGLWP